MVESTSQVGVGIPSSVNEALTRMICCIQAGYEKQYRKG